MSAQGAFLLRPRARRTIHAVFPFPMTCPHVNFYIHNAFNTDFEGGRRETPETREREDGDEKGFLRWQWKMPDNRGLLPSWGHLKCLEPLLFRKEGQELRPAREIAAITSRA